MGRPGRCALAANPAPQVQLACAITRTNERSHDVIRAGLGRSPLFAGCDRGQGPRYCPSIEDKVHRFGDRDGHQIFLEPEGRYGTPLVYPNGISTRCRRMSSWTGAQHRRAGAAEIVQPAMPWNMNMLIRGDWSRRSEHREVAGLFLAGQINGRPAMKRRPPGLVAGLNAAAAAGDLRKRGSTAGTSYIGVMVDDLTLQGVSEPYRMLTARSEYRLICARTMRFRGWGQWRWRRAGPQQEASSSSEAGMRRKGRQVQRRRHPDVRSKPCGVGGARRDPSGQFAPSGRKRRMRRSTMRSMRLISTASKRACGARATEPGHSLGLRFRTVPGLSNEMRERLDCRARRPWTKRRGSPALRPRPFRPALALIRRGRMIGESRVRARTMFHVKHRTAHRYVALLLEENVSQNLIAPAKRPGNSGNVTSLTAPSVRVWRKGPGATSARGGSPGW